MINNKKIGIITFHASHNAGSMLQAYALKKTLVKRYSDNVEIINFSNIAQQNIYSIFPKIKKLRHFIRNLFFVLFYKKLKGQFDAYEDFKHQYLNVDDSLVYSTSDDLKQIEGSYDVIISGGDQVWNTKCEDGDIAYFIPFDNQAKKISYSVSMGATNILEIDPSKMIEFKNYIQKYSSISVRERNSQKWLKVLLERDDIFIQPDPTLLLSQEEWSKLAGEKEVDKPYIFFYSMAFNPEICELLKKISFKYSMPVYVMDTKAWVKKGLFRYGFKLVRNGGPITFLNLMKYADLVVTNSLHGTMFSAIFERPFWSMKSYIHNDKDDRAIFLLEQLHLSDRFIEVDKLSMENVFAPVQFEHVKEEIQKLKNSAITFLEYSIKKDDEKKRII